MDCWALEYFKMAADGITPATPNGTTGVPGPAVPATGSVVNHGLTAPDQGSLNPARARDRRLQMARMTPPGKI